MRKKIKMAPLLDIENLHISYGAIKALKGISLTLDEGEIVTVLGANGAGKSTLMDAISGLVPIEHGTIMAAGEILNKIPAYEIVLKGVSLSPEGRRVFTTLSVDENLRLGAYTRRSRKKEVGEAKDRVFSLFPILAERHRQLAGTLSGGEQQMLAIGRALMTRPKLLMMDEPSMGIAPIIVKNIFQTIFKLSEKGMTILLVEQNAKAALKTAKRGYVLETGQIVLEGSSDELLNNNDVQRAYLGKEYKSIDD